MTAFISWYLIISLLGWLTLPLVQRLFPALPDRGFTMARAAGLLVWGYAFWLMATLGFVHNDMAGLLLAALVLLALSGWALAGQRAQLSSWLKENWRLALVGELLFLAAFALMAFIRAANPEIVGTEKPMELAFINGILRSPDFPPRDPWLSGYAISYYHFGYILTAMLARLSGIPGTLAFNLMLALVFGMSALGSYGVVYNLWAAYKRSHPRGALGLPLLGPLFLLLVSNVEGFLEVLHRTGLFWRFNADGTAASPFWSWLDMKDLTLPPTLPLGLEPDRYLWWWRASRVVQDYDLAGNFQEVIDEFPAFSFLLGDLHPHVLAIPFGLLAVTFALNLYLGGLKGSMDLLGARLHLSPLGFFSAAFLLGGLAFLNIWDILMAAALIGLAYLMVRVRQAGWGWGRLEDLLLLLIPLAVIALLLYLPFFLGFSSQAGGILPNLVSPARGAHLWIMFGTLLIPLFLFLIYLPRRVATSSGRDRIALAAALGLPLALWAFSWLMAWLISLVRPDFSAQFVTAQGVSGFAPFFAAATLRRLGSIGGLLTLALLLFLALRPLLAPLPREPEDLEQSEPASLPATPIDLLPFVALLALVATLLVLAPEFAYLRDQFGTRMNTIFKFYYQAWMLWSLSAAFGILFLMDRLRGLADWLFRAVLLVVLVVGLTYPVLAFANKTNNFKPYNGFTLDDFKRVQRENPDEAGAIQYLLTAPDGVVAEAIGGSYSGFARIATYTGLPTVLGWPSHEVQWRGTADPQGSRQQDIESLYATPDWETARAIIDKYNIRYIVVGGLERQAYPVQEDKFRTHLLPVYQTGTISIYQVPR
jgi:YYY domain-containing protein